MASLFFSMPLFAQSITPTTVFPIDTLSIRYDETGKSAIFVSGKVFAKPVSGLSLNKMSAAMQNKALCQQFLLNIKRSLKIKNPSVEFDITDLSDASASGSHYKIRQKYLRLLVLGAEATVHINGNNAQFVGRTIASPAIDVTPALSGEYAIQRAITDLRENGIAMRDLSAEEKSLLEYTGPTATLVIFPLPGSGDSSILGYQVLVRPTMMDWWEYIVDAKSGVIVSKINRTRDAGDVTTKAKDLRDSMRTIHAYQSDKYYLIDASRPMFNASKSQIPNTLTGALVTYDYNNKYPAASSFNLISNTQNSWDPKAVSAQYNASVAYEYYRTTHGRNSINGNGGSILSFINVADQTGAAMDNAYWNGKGMFYGNGSRVFYPLAAALDVAGHELTHGVVEATAALGYAGQTGALNESMADIFGCMIDRSNWKMGETVVRPGLYPSNALRDLSNPHNGAAKGKTGWQPQSMKEYQVLPNTSAGDNGGVHINDGIPNYAYYLFATAVTKEIAEKVYYRTLTTYLGSSAQFIDLRISSLLACEELYGKGSPEAVALASAFDSVGILDNMPRPVPQPDLPINPGRESVLLTAAPPASDGTTLYIADSAFGSLKSISKRKVKSRPSVSDDGKKALFVSSDKMLIALSLDVTPVVETIVDSTKVWGLCALSRDGQKYAAVKETKDTSIYIGSMNGGKPTRFNLNGPLDSGSRAVTGAVYSSAIEWNYSGEEVIYDVCNSLSGSNGMNITNWDIGLLSAWDQSGNTLGDGEVSKLFNNLPDGLSVGNPTFSKNSPNIIAYESIDNSTYTISMLTMNMETRKTVTVLPAEDFPGYPSYSKADDKIAFTAKSGTDTVVSVIALNTDKQTPSGGAVIKIHKMKWPLFFATGNRAFPTRNSPNRVSEPAGTADLIIVPCARGVKALINPGNQPAVRITIARMDGKIVLNDWVKTNGKIVTFTWNGKSLSGNSLGRGMYVFRIQTSQAAIAKKVIVNW